MSNCTCGRTTRPPFCDNSHALTDQQYAERTERLSKLKANMKKNNWVNTVANNLPEHSEYMGKKLIDSIDNSPYSELDTHAIALVAAILSNNGELGFEIGMNGPLIRTQEREVAKLAAAAVHDKSIYSSILDDYYVEDWITLYKSAVENKYEVTEKQFYLYLLAGSIVLKDKRSVESNPIYWDEVNAKNMPQLLKLCGVVASIGKIAV